MNSALNQEKIRVGIIGVGFAGEASLKGFKKNPNVEVVALAGLEEDRLEYLSKTYAIANSYLSYKDLLQRDDLDAVSIGVPNHLHAPIALAAFERGLHVLCEKPLARTSAEAETMVEAATRANRVLQVIFNHRERTDVQTLKRYIDEGKLGNIYYAKAYWMRRRGIPGAGTWFVNKNTAGGGPLIDLGVHVLDMALFLLGEPSILTVSASTYNELGTRGVGINISERKSGVGSAYEVEDLASAFIRLSTGGTLLLETSWATHSSAQDDYGVVLYGTEGGAEIRVKNYTTENALHIYTDIAGVPADISPRTSGGNFHVAVVDKFVENILSGNWSRFNGSEGLRRARVIDACYTSALQGREVVVEA
ncbi:Gfo/Idh/MocA family protein [Tengunoibacter tsumagoiensis]|uniref:Oxidoreductase n=1 Tax=Tengunoibacter tsumagoiensis TaxID=2014871 RepID=A0A401ZX13_9CHLR|nr:Gfo/Idh/MocA family oxidoreductase [Tengunoibacter tsumagoiensis]GCE11340.1 oxidoreductase [Tengunoibacter tsumagoiensis]